jgi:cysteine desulfurase family protein (TIGR01976 family)
VTAAAQLDEAARLAEVRAQFPALARRHNGHSVAYFDGPGGTQVPQCVVDAMGNYLLHHNANTHWEYPTSRETDALIDAARQAFADFFNATPAEVVFGPNMTTLTFHLARALGRAWAAGDEVVVTELEHHGNVGPWQALAVERGIRLRWVPLHPADGTLDLDDLAAALGPRTRLVTFGWASNALGTVNDVAAICRLARQAGALTFVDAVHSAPHLLPDVALLGCDFLVCSAYKFYGPHLGILYARRARLESLDVPKVAPAPDTAPERLELGTQIHEGIVGAARAVDFLAELAAPPPGPRRARLEASYRWLRQRGDRQARELWDGLRSIPGLRCYGPPPASPRTPTISFSWSRPSAQVAAALAERGVFASHGDFYAATVIQRLGVEGLVRVGCACFTDREIDQLLQALTDLGR